MSRKTSGILLVVCATAGLGILVFAASSLYGAYQWRKALKEIEQANPLELEADLSRTGRYRGILRQTYSACQTQVLLLASAPPFSSAAEAAAALEGLNARFRVEDADGSVQLAMAILIEDISTQEGQSGAVECVLLRFEPPPQGRHDVLLAVETPSKGLVGRSHWLASRYALRAVDYLPMFYSLVAGGMCVLVSGGLAYVTRRLARRLRRAES